ncbi:MAG: sigma-70 family RNA polymerase sigma factor [Deltaproteobacteria bacterium]
MIRSEARGAWKEIEGRLRPYIASRVASNADVDDVLQEVFARMHAGLASLRDGERFGGWVYQIASHALADLGRKRARDPLAQGVPLTEFGFEDAEGEIAALLQAELGACVALFVARLPSPYRQAVTLTDLQGIRQSEAAEMLGISISGMKSRVQRGREKIRDMFEECCQVSVDCRGRIVECEPRALEQVPEDCRGAARAWAARRT